uniref:Colony stimulating factor 3 receptor n=1 Tax=Fundulus heteroclitus TaxID=8078 RepID=A0A3Q2NN09_FUNHE
MISTWMLVIVMLVGSSNGASSGNDTQPCARINTSSLVVPLGSRVTATCVIREDCPLGQDVHIEWRLVDELILSSPAANGSNRVSTIVVPSFNRTSAELTCRIKPSSQVLAGVVIQAGYPPEIPQNLSCQTNLTDSTLNCRWDPGQRVTHLPTKYTLYTEIRDLNTNNTYELPPDIHHHSIPRTDFGLFTDMMIYVKAENDLGEASSAHIVLEPVCAAKFDQPSIVQIDVDPKKLGCLKLTWTLSPHQEWLSNYPVNLEVRYKTAGSDQWSDPPIPVINVKSSKVVVKPCHLLHGTQYLAQIRVRCKQSPWSEWSSSKSRVTLETAPTGRLDSWVKVSRNHTSKNSNIQLFWKPSKQFRGNGQNLTYVVSQQKLDGERGRICSTSEKCCAFQLSWRTRKVYLRAVNRAGKSPPTEIRIYKTKDYTPNMDVTAVPLDDRSFLVQWTAVVTSSLTGYVVEWKPLLKTGLCHTHFEIVNKSQSSLLITGSFEPYKPYGISVYPRFRDGIGPPQTVNAYLRQKAPSAVPKLEIKKTWGSYIEIFWDELPLEQRNGFIKGYKVFYREENGPIKVVSADAENRRVILKDLNSASLIESFMMVSTFGGSLNGSTIHFEIKPVDSVTVVILVTAGGVGLAFLIIFIVLTCLSKTTTLKRRFYPVVPDPANSSIKKWSSESTQFIHPSWDNNEPNPIYLSHLSFLDLTTKLSKEEDDIWSNSLEETSDLGDSISGSLFTPTYSGSNSEVVPYATVLCSSSSNGPTPDEHPVYLRSESTQPLLETEESFSPKCYQNVATNGMPRHDCFFGPSDEDVPGGKKDPALIWDDFPFLHALAMNEMEND